LAQADAGNEPPIVNFVGRAVERSLTLYLEACTSRGSMPDPAERWIPLRQAVEGTPYSQEYLSLLARSGRLEAVKRGKVWYTTRQAVDAYRQSAGS
ncbi:MAG: Fic family protein, partial [Anaerolineae bacterium]